MPTKKTAKKKTTKKKLTKVSKISGGATGGRSGGLKRPSRG